MTNHSKTAEFLWKIADLIKDDYEAKDYEDVMLPLTLLRRLDCVLESTRDAVRKAAEKYKKRLNTPFVNNADEFLDFMAKTETDPTFGKFFFSEMYKWYEKSFPAHKPRAYFFHFPIP